MKLKQKIFYLLSLLAVAVMSSWLTQMATGERRLAVEEAEPVYLIGSVTVYDYERLPDIRQSQDHWRPKSADICRWLIQYRI